MYLCYKMLYVCTPINLTFKCKMKTIDTSIFEPANWELTSPRDRMFTSDHVLDAYLTGQKQALKSEQKLIMDKLITNLKTSSDYTAEIIGYLNSVNIAPTNTFLKINSWDNYSILIVITEKDFISDSIDGVYEFIGNFEDKVSSDFYKLDISICDTTEGVDETCVKSDGFSLKFRM